MDTIKAEKRITKFCSEPHLAIVVNDLTLDFFIAKAFREERLRREAAVPIPSLLQRIFRRFFGKPGSEFDYEGSAPTLLDWFDELIPYNKEAKETVWKRLDAVGEKPVVVPLLMCPDDLDFSCFIIVAEIRSLGDTVRWERIGLDDSEDRVLHPDNVGTVVEWFEYIPPLVFPKEEYVACVQTFRDELMCDDFHE